MGQVLLQMFVSRWAFADADCRYTDKAMQFYLLLA